MQHRYRFIFVLVLLGWTFSVFSSSDSANRFPPGSHSQSSPGGQDDGGASPVWAARCHWRLNFQQWYQFESSEIGGSCASCLEHMNRVANKTAAKGHPRAMLHQLILRWTFQVLFRGTYWARSWSQLSKEKEKITWGATAVWLKE